MKLDFLNLKCLSFNNFGIVKVKTIKASVNTLFKSYLSRFKIRKRKIFKFKII